MSGAGLAAGTQAGLGERPLSTLLSTKLYVPRPHREIVSRPRLLERLDAGMQGKLTLVSAPAGYGKTTLVSDWIARSKVPVAWLSLDAADNDLARFFSYLIASLQGIHPDIGTDVQSILEPEADPVGEIEHLLTALVNDIAASATRVALVLDGYHLVNEFKIHRSLDFVLDHLPSGMHVVIITRVDPPMPLGRLRAQRQLTEIRVVDLRFTLDETTAFLNDLRSLALSRADVENLDARTEGWIAGLQLAALTLQGRADKHDLIAAFSGSHRHLIDYLVPEVLSRQSGQVQEFLLRTSILGRFNASLCDALTQETDGLEILDLLERANLFLIPLDNERRWYRYHHLFADFLQQRLRETHPGIVSELFIRASQWYETRDLVEEAIDHALAGEDLIRAARLLDGSAETYFLVNAEISRLLRWANRLPVDVRAKFPRLCIYHAWALQFEYQLEAVEPTLALAEAHLAEPTRLPPGEEPAPFSASQITGHANAVRAYTAYSRGEFDKTVSLSLQALEALPKEETVEARRLRGVITLALGMGYFELGQMEASQRAVQTALPLNQQAGSRYAALACIQYLMLVEIARGRLNQAHAVGEKGLFWIEEWSRSEGRKRRPARMMAHLRRQMGEVQYERNDLHRAAKNLHKATDYYELEGSWYRVRGYVLLVDLYQALGQVETALGYLRRLERITLTPGFSVADVPLAAQIAARNLSLRQFRPDLKDLFAKAVGWAETSGLRPEDEVRCERAYEYLTLARVWIAQDKAEEAIPLLGRLITCAEGAGRRGRLIAHLSVQAVAYHARDRTDSALAFLSRALAIGGPEGYIRTFVDLGEPMRKLLRATARQHIAPGYVSTLLAAFTDSAPSPAARREGQGIGVLVEPLTEREMQILRLLAARLSYREIAEELYLSLNTIKWYVKNIYGKLGVSKRDQAAFRARELGLL